MHFIVYARTGTQQENEVLHIFGGKKSVWHLKNEAASCAASYVPAKHFYCAHWLWHSVLLPSII